MKAITLPELAMVAGTRVALGAGMALLLANWLDSSSRRAVGWTLFAVGALTTIPRAAEVLARDESQPPADTDTVFRGTPEGIAE